jgi:hypothetical protein
MIYSEQIQGLAGDLRNESVIIVMLNWNDYVMLLKLNRKEELGLIVGCRTLVIV